MSPNDILPADWLREEVKKASERANQLMNRPATLGPKSQIESDNQSNASQQESKAKSQR